MQEAHVGEATSKLLRLLMIGQAPSRETDGLPPFVGKCGKFLAELMGMTQDEMLAAHDFRNVLGKWPGKGINGDRFPMAEAREAADRLIPECRGRAVILLGSNVARAFSLKKFGYMELYQIRDPKDPGQVMVPLLAVVPHPSGVNRFYNDPTKRYVVSKFLRSLAGSRLEKSETNG